MDHSTFEVRLASWMEIISQCQARPDGMTARQWLADNNISEKSYYYWLRRVRLNALGKQPEPLFVRKRKTMRLVLKTNAAFSATFVALVR